jgi:hypothetical protein
MSKFDGMMNQHKKISFLPYLRFLDSPLINIHQMMIKNYSFFCVEKFIAFSSHPLSRAFKCEYDGKQVEEN